MTTPPSAPPAAQPAVWLIERGPNECEAKHIWFNVDEEKWYEDASRATRFPTEERAYDAAIARWPHHKTHGPRECREFAITEHLFIDGHHRLHGKHDVADELRRPARAPLRDAGAAAGAGEQDGPNELSRYAASIKQPEPQCTGPFSDAFDCPVHDPRRRAHPPSPLPAPEPPSKELGESKKSQQNSGPEGSALPWRSRDFLGRVVRGEADPQDIPSRWIRGMAGDLLIASATEEKP